MRRDGDGRRRAAGAVGAVLVLLALAGCGGDDDGDGDDPGGAEDEGGSATAGDGGSGGAGPSAQELCDDAVGAEDVVTVATGDLTETSGIALSRQSDGVLWAHNDSGG